MIKKPADLKTAFSNGALPDQEAFGNLIDSFLPRDTVSDQDLAALREMAVWWRNGGPGTAGPSLPPSPAPPPGPGSDPVPGQDPARPGAAPSAPAKVTVPADGSWARLPVTTAQPGIWTCSAATLQPRPGYRVSANAVAVSEADGKHLLQYVERDSLVPWRTLQFAWRPIDGSDRHYLALRARRSFGADGTGADASILCTIEQLAPHA